MGGLADESIIRRGGPQHRMAHFSIPWYQEKLWEARTWHQVMGADSEGT